MSRNYILFGFCVLLHIGFTNQDEVQNLLNDVLQLYQNIHTYENPINNSDFYQETYNDGGSYGTYDFIIVGAGSAGTVLANRLSERANWKILLLETGVNETDYVDIPAYSDFLQFTKYNWGYRTTPQKNACFAMENNMCNYPRGKSLGGSSSINFMIYSRGNKNDFNSWCAAGNSGWCYNDVLPYFKKSEKSTLTHDVDPMYHGKNGTLSVEHVKYFDEYAAAYLKANEEFGKRIGDYNGRDELSYSQDQLNTINGKRCSGNKAFLTPATQRSKNLVVQTNALVTKILIDQDTAKGVQFILGNKLYKAFANKEVIISAGTINSPQLLMLSGIGPKNHLKNMNITVTKNLPVGQNMGDHPYVPVLISTNITQPNVEMKKLIKLYLNGQGPLTVPNNIQALGFDDPLQFLQYPKIEYLFIPYLDVTSGFLNKSLGYSNKIMKELFAPFPNGTMTFCSILLHPLSRGSVTLKSNNPIDFPNIDINYFDNKEDLKTLAKSIKYAYNIIVNSTVFKKYNASIPNNPLSNCKRYIYLSEEYFECYVKYLASTLYHPVGTCKMGPIRDPNAVVNDKLQVKGIKRLRVVDASIIPQPLHGHPNAAIYMIAEKISDIIKNMY